MKKILLTLSLAFATIFASAQCTPDPQFTIPGIYPDSSTGMPDAIVGQPYNEIITVIVSTDTTVDFNGLPISVEILEIELTDVANLPPSFTYDCLAPNCIFPGASTKCAEVYSTTDPTISDIGFYPITFECIAHLEVTQIVVISVDCTYGHFEC